MAALDEFNGCFTFSYAAVPHQKQAFAVYLNQYPVAGNAGRKLYVHVGNQSGHQAGSGVRRAQDGDIVFFRRGHQFLKGLQIPGNDNGRRAAGQKL